MSAPTGDDDIATAVNFELLADNASLKQPTSDDLASFRTDASCLIGDHDPAECPTGCKTSFTHLARVHFIEPTQQEDGHTTGVFTARFVWALAHLIVRNVVVNWRLVTTCVTANCSSSLPNNSPEVLRVTVDEAVKQLRTTEDLAQAVRDTPLPAPAPTPPRRPVTPIVTDTSRNRPKDKDTPNPTAFDMDALQTMLSSLATNLTHSNKTMIEYFQEKEADSNSLLLSRAARLTWDNSVHVAAKFHGHLEPNKENYKLFRHEFLDRKRRLTWDDQTATQQLIYSLGGRARQIVHAAETTAFGDERKKFQDNFEGLLTFLDENFGASGPTYYLNWAKSSTMKDKEFYQDFITRNDIDLAKFWMVHETYGMEQLVPKQTYLSPGQVSANPSQIEFANSHQVTIETITANIAEALRGDTPHHILAREHLQSNTVKNLLAKALPPLLQETYNSFRILAWENFLRLTQWTHTCWTQIDGISDKKLREEGYKHRDKWYAKANLHTPEGARILKDFKFHMLKTANIHYDSKTYLSINSTAGNRKPATGNPPTETAEQAAAKAKKNQKGNQQGNKGQGNRRGRTNAVEADGTETPPCPPGQPTSTPRAPQVSALRGRGGFRGRPQRGAYAGPPAIPRRGVPDTGAPYIGDDGLRRTPGALCTGCGRRGHTVEDCAITGELQQHAVHAGGRPTNHDAAAETNYQQLLNGNRNLAY